MRVTLLSKLSDNLTDARQLGPGFLLRHIAKWRRQDYASVMIANVGLVHFRATQVSDAAVFRQVFTEQQYDLGAGSPVAARALARYREILAAGEIPVIVDAGANVGASSLWFRGAWPEATVVAVEPEGGNAAVLRRNLDGKPGFVVLEAAIGAERGAVQIAHDHTGWGSRTERSEAGIPVVTIDDAVAAVPGGTLFIAKIDIEGFEDDLFTTNTGWIERAFIVMIEPHDWLMPGKHTSRSFQRAMAAHDFELFISGENLIYVRVER